MNLPGRLSLLLVVALAACAPAPDPPPNIIYILADDLGYGELGSYGQTLIQTPNLDQLAADGMRFTQHYSGSPVCAPSRGALLTGKHTGTGYIRDNYEMGGWGPEEPEGQLALPDEEFTLGEMFKQAGYATGFVGKWGLGGPESEGHPNEQGFDRFYGYLCQRVAHNYYPTHLWSDHTPDSLAGNSPWYSAHQRIEAPLETEEDYYEAFAGETYAPDRMIEEAIRFVDQHAEEPFFLVFATPVPHLALQVPPESLDPYRGQFPENAYLGQPYLPHPMPLAAYAAMISRMDGDIGLLLERLDELGIGDDTLVMFSSDNGTTYTGGVDAEFFDSEAGLRGLKGSVYEGGVRVPMIARWRGRIAPGSVTDQISAFWDVMPTLADIIGLESPADIDGESFASVLRGEPAHDRDRPLYWEYHAFGAMQGVRMGRWKGVRLQAREHPEGPIALFDLEVDPGETTDVALQHPGVVARIDSVMQARTPARVGRWNLGAAYDADWTP